MAARERKLSMGSRFDVLLAGGVPERAPDKSCAPLETSRPLPVADGVFELWRKLPGVESPKEDATDDALDSCRR